MEFITNEKLTIVGAAGIVLIGWAALQFLRLWL